MGAAHDHSAPHVASSPRRLTVTLGCCYRDTAVTWAQETHRALVLDSMPAYSMDSDERTLMEIYYPPIQVRSTTRPSRQDPPPVHPGRIYYPPIQATSGMPRYATVRPVRPVQTVRNSRNTQLTRVSSRRAGDDSRRPRVRHV